MNKQFKSLYDEVVKRSNRPDVPYEIKAAIKSATLTLHQLDAFPKDISSALVSSVSSNSIKPFSFSLAKLPRVRAIVEVAPYMPNGCCVEPLTANPPTTKCRSTTNWWKMQGPEILVSSNWRTNQYAVSFLQNPETDENLYSSWIAETYPHILVTEALRQLFMDLRDQATSNTYANLLGSRERLSSGYYAVIIGEQLQQTVEVY